jgi:hypothetical protein
MAPLLQAMTGMEQAEVATMSYTDYSHHFHWFFLFGVMMLMLEGIISSDMFFRNKIQNT